MKFTVTSLLIFMLFVACNTPKPTTTTVTTTTTQVKEERKLVPWDAILGIWKMESYQVFAPEPNLNENKTTIWEFKNDRDVTFRTTEGKKSSFNKGRYWMNKSIINVDGTLYMFSFESPYDSPNPKPLGEELWLDSNIDPSISNDGPKIYFTKVK